MKTFSGRRASQNEFELRSLISLFKNKEVKRYAEIGARDGDTFHEVMINLPVGSYGLAVDLPGGLWGKSTTVHNLRKAVSDLREKGYDVHYILGDSTDPRIIKKVKSHGLFDAALIDGDHTLEGVTKDWENYKDCASIVAFHDIVGQGQAEKVHNNPVEVPEFWAKVKEDYEVSEYVDAGSKMGIGVIHK